MQNHTGKTKTAMLLELESIKGLLVEEDDIPILQEIVSTLPQSNGEQAEAASEEYIPVLSIVVSDDALIEQAPVQQRSIAAEQHSPAPDQQSRMAPAIAVAREQYSLADIAEGLMASSSSALSIENARLSVAKELPRFEPTIQNITSTINTETATASPEPVIAQHRQEQQQDFFQLVEEYHPEPELETGSKPQALTSEENRPDTATLGATNAASQNPFLPEHIRARLQRSSSQSGQDQAGDIHSKRFKGLALGSIHSSSAKKPSPIQQQLINEIMDKMLPEMAKELRARLEKMNKQMLEQLLAEHKNQ